MNKICFFIVFIYGFNFAQTLEENIYASAEAFIENKDDVSFKVLEAKESTFKNLVKTKDEQLALIFLQTHKGFYLFETSKLKEAITTYEDALKRFNDNEISKITEFDIIENCLKPLGTLYTKTGDFTNALITINQYTFLAEQSRNIIHQISGGINLAKLYQTTGNHNVVLKTVDAYLTNYPTINKYQKEKLVEIKIDSQIALNLLPNYEATSLPTNDLIKSKEQLKIYKIELKNKNYKVAFDAFRRYKNYIGLNLLREREFVQIHIEEAQLYYLLENRKAALKSLNIALNKLLPNYDFSSLPQKEQLYADNKFIDIFDLFAEVETNPKKALQYFDLSFYASYLTQHAWTSQETKILNETSNRVRSEKCIDILFDIFKKTKNKAYLYRAFQYSENHKASALKDIFQKKLQLQHFPKDSLLIKAFNLQKEQERITSLLVKSDLNSVKLHDLSLKLSAINMKLKSLKSFIAKKKYPSVNRLISLDLLKKQLIKDKLVFTEYFYGKNSIYQFIIKDNDIVLNRIPKYAKTSKKIIDFITLFNSPSAINNDIQNYTNQALEIYKLLKFDALSSFKNVLVIPDGFLNFLPFEALLSEKVSTTSFSTMPFVITKQEIIYNSSAFFYINKIKKNENHSVLGFFPVFDNSKQALSHSVIEAEAIKKEVSSHILMRAKATKANFIDNVSNYGVLHLSTHGSSGKSIKNTSIDFYNSTLYLSELHSLNINSNLVVLSACETGVGKLFKGENAMSIARGFQYSGVNNLLFSLWQINDLSTAQIMQSFYKNYNKTKSASYSNRQSKLAYLKNENINNAKKSPYYWSAFVYYGELIPPRETNLMYCIYIVIIFIIVFLLFKFKRSHVTNIN